ncbi:MAG: 4-hydroxythreonine-4-phosphate dehydrogenase PdxA [Alphaproteobacteria bacterium CG_4_10_14_0_2_um_filter_63_37]|nr:MAG: 4-hydroxythreonine-4-phosphate dehydrogenase PdxA [Proteobacteria bacterium CG1_02_64_396]PJA25362.1 MAG: 4-hydroxythreonine-4-phosphate dehydrogenase PdxA [Alphaproteobacteria bacterium CG_4_10_14_0_2_um_filter_63_37]
MNRPILAITLGDPAGIGPEIILRALASPDLIPCRPIILGHPAPFEALLPRIAPDWRILCLKGDDFSKPLPPNTLGVVTVGQPDEPLVLGSPSPGWSRLALSAIDEAVRLAAAGNVDAIVTAPIAKAQLRPFAAGFIGHTEYIAAQVEAEPVMMLAGRGLRVALITTHIPLRSVPDALTTERTLATIRGVDTGLRRWFHLRHPRLLLSALNPHAGESGQFGREEIEILAPAVEQARAEGIEVTGPISADTLFIPQKLALADAVICPYHDQALIPLKMHAFGSAVNVTLGLPFPRTSPDHGTAFDIAPQLIADPASMSVAIQTAVSMTQSPQESA